MQGVDGEWVEIDGERLDFEGACATVIAEEDEGFPISSGEVSILDVLRFLEEHQVLASQNRLGWECPKCHACHAPHVDSCPNCLPQYAQPIVNPSPFVYPTTIGPCTPNGDGTGVFWDNQPVTISVGGTSSDTRFDSEGYSYAPYVPTEISCEYSDQYE
jgi:hypothetical protein